MMPRREVLPGVASVGVPLSRNPPLPNCNFGQGIPFPLPKSNKNLNLRTSSNFLQRQTQYSKESKHSVRFGDSQTCSESERDYEESSHNGRESQDANGSVAANEENVWN